MSKFASTSKPVSAIEDINESSVRILHRADSVKLGSRVVVGTQDDLNWPDEPAILGITLYPIGDKEGRVTDSFVLEIRTSYLLELIEEGKFVAYLEEACIMAELDMLARNKKSICLH